MSATEAAVPYNHPESLKNAYQRMPVIFWHNLSLCLLMFRRHSSLVMLSFVDYDYDYDY